MSFELSPPSVVARVAAVLRGIGGSESSGVGTTELARRIDLPRPTVHRLLAALELDGLVDRDPRSGRWHLGPEMYLLGTVAAARYDVSHHARRVVLALAEKTGESAFFSARRGDQTVCLLRQDGSFPLRSHVLHEGLRLPLGVASAGLVILSHLPDREVDQYVARVDLTAEWGESHAAPALLRRVADTRRAGYSTNPGLLVEGSWGMGAAVFDASDNPAWALSLTGVETRFSRSRRPELGRLLLDAAHALSHQMQVSAREVTDPGTRVVE